MRHHTTVHLLNEPKQREDLKEYERVRECTHPPHQCSKFPRWRSHTQYKILRRLSFTKMNVIRIPLASLRRILNLKLKYFVKCTPTMLYDVIRIVMHLYHFRSIKTLKS